MTRVIPVAALWCLTLAVFWRGLGGAFVWDDGLLIANNALLESWEGLKTLLGTSYWNLSGSEADLGATYRKVYRPWVTFSFFVQRQVFGLDPRGYHAVSLVLHLYNVALVFLLVAFRMPKSRLGVALSWLAALLFALHPSKAESVAWISGSTDLWMTAFALTGYWVWVRAPKWTWLSCALFALAFLSKETAIVVPVVLAIEAKLSGGARKWRRVYVASATMALVVVGRFLMVSPPGGSFGGVGLARRVVATWGHFVEAIVWPWAPFVERGFRYTGCEGRLVVEPHVWVSAAAGLLVFALLVWNHRAQPAWVAALAWLALPLVPVLNILDLGGHALAPERFLYLPTFGVALLVAVVLRRAWSSHRVAGAVLSSVVVLFVAGCVLTTPSHVAHFRDAPSLWQYEVARNETNMYAVELVATQLQRQGDAASARRLQAHGRRFALSNCNSALAARFGMLAAADALRTTRDTDQAGLRAFGRMYDGVQRGRLSFGRGELKFDIPLTPQQARFLMQDASLFGLPRAIVAMRTLDLADAQARFEAVLEQDPDHIGARQMHATVLARQGKWGAARAALDEAARRLPSGSVDRIAESIERAETLARVDAGAPEDIVMREARVQLLLGAPEAARRILAPLLEASPGDPIVVLAYTHAVMADGRTDLAARVLEQAVRRAPEHAAEWSALRSAIARAAAERTQARP